MSVKGGSARSSLIPPAFMEMVIMLPDNYDRPIYGHSKYGEDPKSELMVKVAAILAMPMPQRPDPHWHPEFQEAFRRHQQCWFKNAV